jgi:hypothetical protein
MASPALLPLLVWAADFLFTVVLVEIPFGDSWLLPLRENAYDIRRLPNIAVYTWRADGRCNALQKSCEHGGRRTESERLSKDRSTSFQRTVSIKPLAVEQPRQRARLLLQA